MEVEPQLRKSKAQLESGVSDGTLMTRVAVTSNLGGGDGPREPGEAE